MSNSLDNLSSYYLPNTLDGINLISDEISNSALLVDGSNFMIADLNMNTHNIKNLDAGVDGTDAVNLTQLNNVSSTSSIYASTVSSASFIYSNSVSSSSKLYADGVANNVSSASFIYSNSVSSSSQLYADGVANNVSSASFIYSNSVSSSSQLYADGVANNVSSASFIYSNSVSLSSSLNISTQSALKVNKAGDTMTGTLNVNYENAFVDIRATQENQNSILYLSTPYLNGAERRKTAIIANGLTNWNRANLHFCLNNQATHNNVSLTDSKMCILNSGNVGIGTTTPTEKLDVNGNAIMRGSLNMNSNKIINLQDGTNSNEAVNKSQLDTKSDTTYVNTQLATKVNRAGDTITGDLTINGSCFSNKQFVVFNSTDTSRDRLLIFDDVSNNLGYLYYNEDGYLGSNETNGTMRWSIDNNGSASLSNSTLTKNASNSLSTLTSSSLTLDLTSGTIYDIYNLTYSGLSPTITLFVPSTTGGTNLLGKSLNITFPSNKSVALSCSIGETITLNGTNYTTTTPDITSPFSLIIDSANQGVYYTGEYKSLTNTDQLTIRSYLDANANSEFTGIRFLNTNTECGFIRVDTNRDHIDANMAFYVRQNNSIINPLTINSNIIANVPIIRNAWSSGELIQTKIYNQNTDGTGVFTLNAGSNGAWKVVNFLMKNPVYNGSQIVIKIDAPYTISGYSQDVMEIKVFDKTIGGIATEIFRKSQYYGTNTGSGTRSSPILPVVISYVPSTTTSTNRSISIEFFNPSNDTLYICQGATQSGSTFGLVNMDYYTIEINEIKL